MKKMHNLGRVVRAILLALAICILAGACAGIHGVAKADDTVNYAVRAILPENQINNKVTYFDLMMQPGRVQVLQVLVKNKGKTEIKVAAEANIAFTNANGVIEFAHSEARDPSLEVDFSKIVTVLEPVMTIPAESQKTAEFMVRMPDEPFEGVVYGGFMFTKLDQGTTSDGTSGTGIRNVYRYVIGARLYEGEMAVEPEFELLGASVAQAKPMALRIDLRNPKPAIARQIAMRVDVYPAEGGEAAFSATRENLEMAPNTSMPYMLYFGSGKSRLKAGKYKMNVHLSFEGREWQFETPLVVK